jgi:hypothetical protein
MSCNMGAGINLIDHHPLCGEWMIESKRQTGHENVDIASDN